MEVPCLKTCRFAILKPPCKMHKRKPVMVKTYKKNVNKEKET